jgi:hypothetical protein
VRQSLFTVSLSLLTSLLLPWVLSMALLDKLDSHRRQSEIIERGQAASQSSSGPILMMAITDEYSNHPNAVTALPLPPVRLSGPVDPTQVSLEEKYQCLQMPKKNGDEVTVVPCDSTNRLQFFSQERCISINANVYNASQYRSCPSEFHSSTPPPRSIYPNIADTSITEDENPDPQIYCRYRSTHKSDDKRAPSLCLDIKGQQLSETSILG